MEDGKCSVHRRILEHYCGDDSGCVCSWTRAHWGQQEAMPDENFKKKKEAKPTTRNKSVEEVARCLREPWREAQRIADRETERASALTTRNKNIEEVARCLLEPSRGTGRIADRETERASALTTRNKNIEEVTRCLQEPRRRSQRLADSETERASALSTRNKNIEEVARCLQEPWRRTQCIADRETERASALSTRNKNIEEVTRCLQEPWRGTQRIADREAERASALTTRNKNIEEVTRCLQEPWRGTQRIADREAERASAVTTRNKNIEEVTRCLQEPWRRTGRIADREAERASALTTRNKNIEEVTRCLQEPWRRTGRIADREAERASALTTRNKNIGKTNALITDFMRWLEDLTKTVRNDISSQAEQFSVSDLIQHLEIKNDELSKTMDVVEELCNMADPLTVLQESDTGDLCDAEDGDYEDGETFLCGGGDLSEAGIPNTSHTGLSDITGVNGRMDIPGPSDIVLDVNTACNFLHLLDDGKTASCSFINKKYPETPERFAFRPQVLSSQSFPAGRHYWDVEVWRSDNWRVGVCYPSIDRKGGVQSVVGNNKKSWCLCRSHDRYSAIHDRQETCWFGGINGGTVRISLDYESGLISFYELGISARHLHTFATTFTEPLHAVLGVWRGCVKISGEESGGVKNLNECGIW